MPKCVKIRRKKRQVCVGDLKDEIILNNRAITPLLGSSVDFGEAFTPTATVFASVNTIRGVTKFDSTNTEVDVTHLFDIRYDSTVTAETWIEFDGRFFDILDVEDPEERHEWMFLSCNERGTTSKEVNFA